MKRLLPLLILFFFIARCRDDQSGQAVNTENSSGKTDKTSYPLFIDGGTRLVYQFGHLTADKGLKLYFDTIPYPSNGLMLDDSLRHRLSVR